MVMFRVDVAMVRVSYARARVSVKGWRLANVDDVLPCKSSFWLRAKYAWKMRVGVGAGRASPEYGTRHPAADRRDIASGRDAGRLPNPRPVARPDPLVLKTLPAWVRTPVPTYPAGSGVR